MWSLRCRYLLVIIPVELDRADLTIGSRVPALVMIGAITTVRSTVVRIHLSLTIVKWTGALGEDALVLALATNIDRR